MTTSRALAAAGLLALAVAGCSSSDSGSDTPDPNALASSIAAQATSPAASSSSDSSGGGDCSDAPLAAKAALTGMDYLDVGMVQGCDILSIVTKQTDPAVGKGMCDNAAGEVWQLGVKSIVVVNPSGTELATAESGSPCKPSP